MSFSRILIAVLFLVMASTAWLSATQGWWWYSFHSPAVMKEYREENNTYVSSYRTGVVRGSASTGLRRSSFASTGSNRSFRSGSRGGRGK
jgi:hypothetical protein